MSEEKRKRIWGDVRNFDELSPLQKYRLLRLNRAERLARLKEMNAPWIGPAGQEGGRALPGAVPEGRSGSDRGVSRKTGIVLMAWAKYAHAHRDRSLRCSPL